MSDVEKLMLLIQEKKYPYFEESELTMYLELYNNDVYTCASELCLMKADSDKKVTVGPITIEGPGAEYWTTLSEKYAKKADKINNPSTSVTGGFKTSMKRSGEREFR